jgi:uncharacterized protein (TIGR01777 family)
MSASAAAPAASIAITGASGFLGSALTVSLERSGVRVVRMVRHEPRGADEVRWDPGSQTVDHRGLEGVEAVVHLAGSNLVGRWTRRRKAEIRDSRVLGTRTLARGLARLDRPPHVLVSGSATGYYGDRGDEWLDEASAPGRDFLAAVVQDWEAATAPAEDAGIRVVLQRHGPVIGAGGGLIAPMLLPFRLGIGGPMGSGRQWVSWISLHDAVQAMRFAIASPDLRGALNAVAPEPVPNAQLARALARSLGRPALISAPAFALRLLYGEMADAMILTSQRVAPNRLREAGFVFRYPRVEDALGAALDPAR